MYLADMYLGLANAPSAAAAPPHLEHLDARPCWHSRCAGQPLLLQVHVVIYIENIPIFVETSLRLVPSRWRRCPLGHPPFCCHGAYHWLTGMQPTNSKTTCTCHNTLVFGIWYNDSHKSSNRCNASAACHDPSPQQQQRPQSPGPTNHGAMPSLLGCQQQCPERAFPTVLLCCMSPYKYS